MKLNFALVVGLAGHTVFASPVVQRDDSTDLATLISTIKTHTANINATLAKLPTVTTTASKTTNTNTATASLATGSANITAQFSAIAQAMTSATFDSASTTSTKRVRNLPLRAVKELESSLSSRQDAQACDATCLSASYQGIGALTAEIAYTVKACVAKNAVDITSSSSVLIPVIHGLATVTKELAQVVGPVAGVVVQNLEAALGADIGGALATFISPA